MGKRIWWAGRILSREKLGEGSRGEEERREKVKLVPLVAGAVCLIHREHVALAWSKKPQVAVWQ